MAASSMDTRPSSATSSSSSRNEDSGEVIYRTWTVCPVCTLRDRTPLKWIPGCVKEHNYQVFLLVQCKVHGAFSTLYCAHVGFFYRMISHALPVNDVEAASLFPPLGAVSESLEQCQEAVNLKFSSVNFPPMVEISLYDNVRKAVISEEAITEQIIRYCSLYPPDRNFVLKAMGSLCTDMELLNDRLLYLEANARTHPAPIVVEISHDRLMALCEPKNTALLCPRVYPAVKFYVRQGEEGSVEGELRDLLACLRGSIKGLQIMVTLAVERPLPKLDGFLKLFRGEGKGLIRILVFTLERPPREIVEVARSHPQGHGKAEMDGGARWGRGIERGPLLNSVDIYELVQSVESASGGDILCGDFFPSSMAMALEPFLMMMRWGRFMLRPSPLFSAGTVIVNSEGYPSTPLSRLVDIDLFFKLMQPLLEKLDMNPKMELGWQMANKIRKILKKCTKPGIKIPDLLSFVLNKQNAKDVDLFSKDMQFIMVQQAVDMGALDAEHICRPGVLTQQVRDLWDSLKRQK
eukprot:Nk52_evm43s745 gene=Nk52_evmTU43s745